MPDFNRYKAHIFVAGLYALLLVSLFFHLFYPTPQLYLNPEYGRSDVSHLNIPAKYVYSQALSEGHIPLWTKDIGTGFPLYAESQMGAMNAVNLVLFTFAPFWIAFNLSYLVLFFFAGYGMFLVMRYLTKNSYAGCATGLLYMFSGFMWTHTVHLNMIQAASLIPWILYFYVRVIYGKNVREKVFYFLILSLMISQQIFAGHLQTSFITGILLLTYTSTLLLKNSVREVILQCAIIGCAFALAFLLSAIQILPTFELHKLSVRSKPYSSESVTFFSLHPKSLLTFVHRDMLGKIEGGTYEFLRDLNSHGNIHWETNVYLGLAALGLVLISLRFVKDFGVQQGWLITIVGLLFMLGRHSPMYFLYSIPPFNFFTTPARFLLIFIVGICIVVAYAIIRIKKEYAMILIGLIILQGFTTWHQYGLTLPVQTYFDVPKTGSYILSDTSIKDYEKSVLSIGGSNWGKYFKTYGWTQSRYYEEYFNVLIPNITELWGIRTYDEYVGRIWTRRKALYNNNLPQVFVENPNKFVHAERMLNMASIDYIQSPIEIQYPDYLKKVHTVNVEQTHNRYIIYKNPNALPRFRVTDTVKQVGSFEDFIDSMSSSTYTPETAFIESNIWSDKTSTQELTASVNVQSEKDQQLVLTTQSNKEALLIISDLYFPGWKVEINGKPSEYYPVNLIQRAVIIPKGRNSVTMWYAPKSYAYGKLISGISYAICLGGVFLSFVPRYRVASSSKKPS